MLEELNGDFLQWLRGFYHVARTGSVRKAAQLMNRNPSTISYQLKCLEEELNVVLFDRIKRSMRITEEGRKLLGWTISTFDTLQNMRSSVSNADGRLKGALRMAATLPIMNLAVPAMVEYVRNFPLVDVNIVRGLSCDVRRMVNDSEVDFGLLSFLRKPGDEKLDILFKARPLLIYSRDTDFHIPRVPSIEDLKRLPYVRFAPSGNMDRAVCYTENQGLSEIMDKNSVITVNNYHLIMRFIWHGIGVGILDELCFQATRFGAAWDRLATIPLDHLFPNSLYGIYTRAHKRLSPQAIELIKCLRTHFLNLQSLDREESWLEVSRLNAPVS